MPQLKDFRLTKIVTLPSYPDSQVEIYDSLLVRQQMQVFKAGSDDLERGVAALAHFVKDWNFTDEQGAKLPVTPASMEFLKEADLLYLFEQIQAFAAESKKKLQG